MIRIFTTTEEVKTLLERSQLDVQEVNATVKKIIADVRARGDAALLEYTERLDRVRLTASNLSVTEAEIAAAYAAVPQETVDALRRARDNILQYHRRQLRQDNFKTQDVKTTGYLIRPVERAGLYVPGGKAAYPSSVLMCACPAIVAGVDEIVMTTPAPDEIGRAHV